MMSDKSPAADGDLPPPVVHPIGGTPLGIVGPASAPVVGPAFAPAAFFFTDEELSGLDELPPWSLANASEIVTKSIGNCFYRLGLLVAKFPLSTALVALVVCGAFSVGNMFYFREWAGEKLWTPYGSDVREVIIQKI